MKVFISWSGQRSKEVAELLSDWVKCVLQASKPWISTRDIDKGAIWFSEISDQLKDTAAGIVCLTAENKDKPWILFETGALAKGLSTNRVCTFLIDLKPSDIEDPLAQFNHTMPDESSLWGLICSLNNCLGGDRLDERILKQVFATYWPQFDQRFADIIQKTPAKTKPKARTEESILGEILENTRVLSSRVRDLEKTSITHAFSPSFESNEFSPTKVKSPGVLDLYKFAEDLLGNGLSAAQTINHLVTFQNCGKVTAANVVQQILSDKKKNKGTATE